ncbi:MAG: DUF5011 domain-containing protein, partial [Verrucomicrobia subdivision 3 bacterium]|nr:DUF5011 domain-containing protein [Limisphaerales bacterium]
DLTSAIVINASAVNVNAVGSYSVTYNVSDPSGNAALTVTRTVNVVDTTPAIITLTGANPMTVECHTAYVEPGATANDTCAGDISGTISVSGTVDANTVGTYTITYMVSDGYQTTTATRTVNVVDTTKPVITLVGANPQVIECHTSYTELGATASDSCAGDLTSAIAINASAVNVNAVGSYTVTYDVSDPSGNAAITVTRTVNVVDTTPAIITLNGANPMTVECHTAYVEPGATASDTCAGDISASISISGAVDANTVGDYTITYTVSDGFNTSTATRTVNVVDTTKPVIALVGANPQIIECHTAYTELGATASDSCAGDLSSAVAIDASAVNVNTVGSYTVTYNLSDPDGNAALTVTRTVNVVDTTPAIITLTGANPMTVECHTAYAEPGATASDTCAGDLTAGISVSGAVDPNTVGSYTITYMVSDGYQTTTATRTVNVVDTIKPVIALLGVNPQIIECHTAYTELGATVSDSCAGDLTSAIAINASAVNVNAIGSYTVSYDVSDPSGNAAVTMTRTIQVVDTTSPTIACPVNIAQPNDPGECGAIVNYIATATDTCDAAPTLTCHPPTGSMFPKGTTTVICSATDASENSALCSFTVTITDAEVPLANCPGDITTHCDAGECGAVVNFGVGASDNCTGASITCNPPSGSLFPVGTNLVTCTALDAAANIANCTFNVIVTDDDPPAMTAPADMMVPCSLDPVVAVTFANPVASDNCGLATIVCEPPSGSTFPVGTTTVTCTATDPSGNNTSCSFNVTRLPFEFNGFLAPLGGADAAGGSFIDPLRTFRLTSNIPLKFRAACSGSAVVIGVHTVQAFRYTSADHYDMVYDATPTDTATTENQFRLTDNIWHFNLDTTPLTKGIWKIVVTLSDGSAHEVWVALRK